MPAIGSRPCLPLLVAVAALSAPLPALAQGVAVCLRNGTELRADRFEARGDQFTFYVPGSTRPLEYPASAIAGINTPCNRGPAAAPSGTATPTGAPATAGGNFAIHGSNTIGERLMPMLIEAFAQTKFGTPPIVRLGQPEEQEITLGDRTGAPTVLQLHAHGSGTSAKSLASGAAQIGMSSRPASDAEVKAVLDAQRVNLRQPGNEHVLALDGLAVIVNPANPVRQLNLDQIARIFSGEIKNWSELGGANAPIKAHRRDDKSGTYDTFNAIVLAPRKLKPGPEVKAYESSEILSDEVFKDANAIGFIGLPYINRNRALSIGSECGIASDPSTFTVKTEAYPLSRRLYLYSMGTPRETMARELLSFTLADVAQPVIKQAGFVEQSVELQTLDAQRQWIRAIEANSNQFLPSGKELPASGKAALSSTAASSRRTTLSLRFDRGSAELDVRARQDVERFARYMKSPEAQGKRFLVVGFADADGSWQLNVQLAYQRAESVAEALRSGGVTVGNDQLVSLSYQAPVACNDTDEGKRKNRRVEIWVRE